MNEAMIGKMVSMAVTSLGNQLEVLKNNMQPPSRPPAALHHFPPPFPSLCDFSPSSSFISSPTPSLPDVFPYTPSVHGQSPTSSGVHYAGVMLRVSEKDRPRGRRRRNMEITFNDKLRDLQNLLRKVDGMVNDCHQLLRQVERKVLALYEVSQFLRSCKKR